MAQRKRKLRLKRKVALALKLSVTMLLIGIGIFYFMDMVYSRGLNVATHGLVLDIEETVSAKDFVEPYDDTPVIVSFLEEPVRQLGQQQVVLVVENRKGRSRKYTETLEWIDKDKTPPQILGVHDISIFAGDTVAYMDGVIAVDETDGTVEVTVDKTEVNIKQGGVYPITYLAADSTGNMAKAYATVTVTELTATQKQAYALADSVLAKITTQDMSLGQKAKAIFDYVHEKVNYTGIRLAADWDSESYAGLENIETDGTSGGDCHTYYAVANVLLSRAGAQVMMVERQNAPEGDKHYWILCNVGTGWYHFDATKINGGFSCFMLTDAQVRDFTNVKANFYDFDAALYPATPTTEFVLE